jgi:hypothetical protein
MSTKLEAVVGLLAGREVEPGLLDELADPSSEASRFLEATRLRSRALFAGPAPPENPHRARSGRGGMIALALLSIAAIVLFSATLQVVDRRFRLLEGRLEARDRESRGDALRLESILGRLAEPRPAPEWPSSFEASLKRLEAGLGRLEAAPEKDAPSAEQLRDDLAAIRRELSTAEKGEAKRSEELQAAIHDAGRVLRLLLNRFDPPPPGPEKAPGYAPPHPQPNNDTRRAKP